MTISIAQRFRPFSHQPGVACPLPLSTWQVRVFPARIELSSLQEPSQHIACTLAVKGPVKDFTVELDLEKGCIRVFGITALGYMNYEIVRAQEGIVLRCKQLPEHQLECIRDGKTHVLKEKGEWVISVPAECKHLQIPRMRLSLGMHKAQDWDLVKRRGDLKEIFPIILRLGEMIPGPQDSASIGSMWLLNTCKQYWEQHKKVDLMHACQKWLQVAFSGILVPRLIDTDFQGILPSDEPVPSHCSPLALLTQGSDLIKRLFFVEDSGQWEILPCLLPSFAAGRLIDIPTQEGESIAIEWSKHELKKMIVQTKNKRTVQLKLPKEIRSLRLKTSKTDRGQVVQVKDRKVAMDLPDAKLLILDRFMR
jgi:hypothetical protein